MIYEYEQPAIIDIDDTLHEYPLSWYIMQQKLSKSMGPVAQKFSPSGAIQWLESEVSKLI